ncbi:MAG: phage/plasmid primase, P4 family [Pyrinomonadaceae bacterium]
MHSRKNNEKRSNLDVATSAAAVDQTITGLTRINSTEHDRVLTTILHQLQSVNFHKKANLATEENVTQKHYVVIAINELLRVASILRFGLCKSENQYFVFNGMFWTQISGDELEGFLGTAAERMGINPITAQHYSFREHLIKQFNSGAGRPSNGIFGDRVLINLMNGTYEVGMTGGKLREFRSDDFLRYQLPFEYTPNASCPKWQQFLDQVLPDKSCQAILAEYIAYVFTDLKLEQVLLLLGSGANGKSVLFEVIKALFGEANVTHYSLASLSGDYQRAMLSGKLLNYSSELSSRFDLDLFKRLSSGEPVEARLPFEKPFIMRRYARLAFNCNDLPRDVEHNEAFFRRFLIVPFDVTIAKEDRDPQLARSIIKDELSGVFNWVIEGLDRLSRQGRFSECAASQAVLDRYRKETDSVALFIEDAGYFKVTEARDGTRQASMYGEYKYYCQNKHYTVVSDKTFGRRLEHQGFTTKRLGSGKLVFARNSDTTDMTLTKLKHYKAAANVASVACDGF